MKGLHTSQILTRVRDDLEEAVAGKWTDLRLIRSINRAYLLVFAEQELLMEDWLLKYRDISIVSGQQEYDLPTDMFKSVSLEILEDSTNLVYRPLNRIEPSDVYLKDDSGLQVTPNSGISHWYLRGGKLGIVPKPSSALASGLRLHYIPVPGALHCGVLAAASATSLTLATVDGGYGIADSRDDCYSEQDIVITNGTAVDVVGQITDYVGKTKVASVALATTPSAGNTYSLYPKTEESLDELIINKACELAVMMRDPASAPKFSERYERHKNQLKAAMEVRARGPQYVVPVRRDDGFDSY